MVSASLASTALGKPEIEKAKSALRAKGAGFGLAFPRKMLCTSAVSTLLLRSLGPRPDGVVVIVIFGY